MKIKATIISALLLLTIGCGSSGGSDPVIVGNNPGIIAPVIPIIPPTPPIPSPTGVVFFRDNAGGGGTGTATSPFNNLGQAIAAANGGEAVFIFAGSGNPIAFTGTVPTNVQLLGEGAGFTAGAFTVPAGAFPRIQGQVTLSNGSTVQGLQFENPTGGALLATGTAGGFVVNNRFSNVTGDAITLQGSTGTFRISDNQFSDDLATNPGEGVLVTLGQTQSLDLTFQNNTFTTPDRTSSFDNGLHVVADGGSQLTLNAQQNNFDNQGNGLNFQLSGGATLTGQVTQNTFTGSGLEGISMLAGLSAADATSSNFTASNNTFTNNLGPGILFRARGNGAGTHDWTIQQNTITAAGSFGILCVRGDASVVRSDISNNTVSNATQVGIQYTSGTASGGFTVPLAGEDRITMTDNQTTGSGVSGIDLNLISVTQAALLTGNTTAGPVTTLLRGTNACLGAGGNNVGGTLTATVEAAFALTFDDRGQTTPTVTFPGAGAVSAGVCQP